MKRYKIIPILLLISVMAISNPTYATIDGFPEDSVYYDTHIDIHSYSTYQGNTKDIKAELWQEKHSKFFRDSPLNNTPINFTIQNSLGETVYTKVIKTNWLGNAHLNFDTTNFPCGEYKILVKFNGNNYKDFVYNGIFISGYDLYVTNYPSANSAKLIILEQPPTS